MLFQDGTAALSVSVVAAVSLPVLLVLVLVICLSCLKKKQSGRFSNFSNTAESTNTSHTHGNTTFTVDINDTNIDDGNSAAITLEPLPDVTTKSKLPTCPLRPQVGSLEKSTQDASLKMIAGHHPFPRSKIVYLKELGTGWFGKVIESDAERITTGVSRSKVVVKMLKDDATKDEQLLFFEEVAPLRELEHPNILRLLGQCTEINPMLMIMECAALGNLKQYLRNHRHQQAMLIQKNRLLKFAMDTSSGLACLHGHGFLHRDLAARNCLVMSDHTLKVGDYGIAEDLFKEDYLSSGSQLLPIRWMAPETLLQTNGTWTSQDFSKESDVWSLGVVLWEIAMLGERPYDMLTDEAVLQGVIVDKDIRLPQPDIGMPNMDRLYEVMQFCWLESSQRVKVDEVFKLLQQIASKSTENGTSNDAISVFDKKWEHLMPNQRHPSVDSIDERLDSVSSEDSNILSDSLSQHNSLEDFTSPDVLPISPQAPPRASKKKVSAAAISIPQADVLTKEVPAAAVKKETEEQMSTPLTILDETGQSTAIRKTSRLPQKQVTENVEENKKPSSSNIEFTEFTSHGDEEKSIEETPDVSGIVPDKGAENLVEKTVECFDSLGDNFQTDDPSSLVTRLEDDRFTFNTPGKPQTEVKERKTSTPIAIDDASPSSFSSLTDGDSSATFVTVPSSSPSIATDAYATASDSTLMTDQIETNFTSSDVSAFKEQTSSENDSRNPEENLQSSPMPNPLASIASSNNNPFTGNNAKEDIFGEFTNASNEDENASIVSKNPTSLSPDTTAQDDPFNLIAQSPETTTNLQSIKPSSNVQTLLSDNKPETEDNVLTSFGTDFSSFGSVGVPATTNKINQEHAFQSITSDLPFLSSGSTIQSHAESPSDILAFDKPSQLASAHIPQTSSTTLDSFDFMSTPTDTTGSDEQLTEEGIRVGAGQPSSDVFGNFSSIPLDSSSTSNPFTGHKIDISPDGGNPNSTEQSAADLFGFRDSQAISGSHDSSFEVLTSQDASKVSAPSSDFSDFDLLSGFTPAVGSSGIPSSPFGGSGDLQELIGATTTASTVIPKDSQGDIQGIDNSSDFKEPRAAAGVEFTDFESADTAGDGGDVDKPSVENKHDSSLIDF